MTHQGSTRPGDGADRRIAELAERQHGVVCRRQLFDLGLGEARVRGRVARRQLHPVHRGVYAVGHRRLTAEGRWMAAVLAAGPGALLSHRSAGQLWRLLRRSPGPIEVTRAVGWRPPAGLLAHRSQVPADERTVVAGIPVTSVPRTLLDLAGVAPRRQLDRAMNEAEILRLTDSLSLPVLLERHPHRRGTAALRAILADGEPLDGVKRNEFEERFAALLRARGLPGPRFNADLVVRGRHFNVDCLWQAARLVVELDGGAVHRTPRAFKSDRERDRILLAEGWRVIRVTWRQLRDEPEAVVGDLRRLLTARSPRPPTL